MAFSESFAVLCVTIVTLIITSSIVAIVVSFIQKRRLEKELSAIPSAPDRHWLLGHIPKLTFDEEELKWGRVFVRKAVSAAILWIGPFLPIVTLFDTDTVKAILSTGEPKAEYTYSFVRPWIGDGLLLSSGKKWARNRRLLTPGFHFDILKPYVGIFQQSGDILVEKWRAACIGGKTSMEMFGNMSQLTLDSLLKCIFSVETNCQTVENHPYTKGINDIANLVVERFRFLPYHIDAIYQWSPSGRRFRRANETVHDYARNIIKQRKKALIEEAANGKKRQRKYIDFLDILLCAKDSDGQGLSDQEIYDEVDTFMFEGHDTTASGLSWFLYNMARLPEFQEKCRQEVDDLLADREKDRLVWDDLNNLPYLTKCLKESLRIHSPVPNVMRVLTQPVTFPDGRKLPKGTLVGIIVSALHNNPHVWDDPDTFDPERFAPDRAKNIPPYAYVPFAAGPRNCIGQHFALNEMKVISAIILRNFHLSVDESVPVLRTNALVLRAENGIHLHITPRKL
ncbi:cytochrome P450 4F4-like [Patiria miniata]|uniref:Cytochrome P450 n=1 Tax=Patiria miniata TaxID=46514 RepID=A0A913Z5X6_PATMI|nr:cytochrome P450 4F4-like [Patiria miniata]XP_038047214.1 cytochrome P450 4F4-like [Patiria miniata]XP_038047215.1 cytochrome P450 4F4-like [Patiria miniata]XP_038047216.1 cytochrome P450 4F4-like [Patiria miniata]